MSAATVFDSDPGPGVQDGLVARGHGVADELFAELDAHGADARIGGLGSTGVLGELDRLIERLRAVRLRVIALSEASGAVQRAGHASTGSWVARQTNTNPFTGARDANLAKALSMGAPAQGQPAEGTPTAQEEPSQNSPGESNSPTPPNRAAPEQSSGPVVGALTRAVLEAGQITVEHARIITTTLPELPEHLTAHQQVIVERDLVRMARRCPPAKLRALARRAIAAVQPDPAAVDAHEDDAVQAEEDHAAAKTSFWLRDNSDGTSTGQFTVPTLAGAALKKIIDAMTAPRRRTSPAAATGATPAGPADAQPSNAGPGTTGPGSAGAAATEASDLSGARARALEWARRRGDAFAELLSHLPTDHLHDKTAATVIVLTHLEELRGALSRVGRTDTGERVSAGQVRRLACQAGIIPAVLGGGSAVLDLGRTARLHNSAQRMALAITYDSCVADGCDRPLAWCETHHLTGWVRGGRTDLDNLIPLCGTHHRWIERVDTSHRTHRHPDGTVTIHFTRRT